MPAKSIDAGDQIVHRLRALVKESPYLKNAALLYEAILPVLSDADLHVGALSLTPEQVREKMEKGLPLLDGLDLELDIEALRDLMHKLARSIENINIQNRTRTFWLPWKQASDVSSTAVHRLLQALEENRLDLSALLPHIAANNRNRIDEVAGSLGLDPGLVTVLAQNALKPVLHALRKQLAPLAQGISWDRGDCYVCGAVATLGELQENDQIKHLRCGSCGADWRFRKLKCMYCGNEDHNTLRSLFAERRERMQVEACDLCRGYLKIISSFFPTQPEQLAIEDLATLHLDYIAQEKGYSRKEALQCK